jgi:hypothetical protein
MLGNNFTNQNSIKEEINITFISGNALSSGEQAIVFQFAFQKLQG